MDSVEEKKPKGEKPKFVARTPTDIQRIKLERLMKNPQKEVMIPSSMPSKNRSGDGYSETPSFVRNVMGSSAGAGSGEFHVYRHLRRKEYARQKQIQQQSVQEKMEEDFRNKIEQNRSLAEQKTAKKRAKRLKKKQRAKNRKPNDPNAKAPQPSNSESSENESDEDDKSQANEDNKSETNEGEKPETNDQSSNHEEKTEDPKESNPQPDE